MPKSPRAFRAPVISLAAVRQARSASPVAEEKECCPYAVMETMIDIYFQALSVQMEKIKSERKKA